MVYRLAFLIVTGLFIGCSSQEILDVDKVIENVHVISMGDEEIQQDRSVLIKDDRIQQVIKRGEVAVADTVERIDGNGGYLIPGLAEMHAHIPSRDASREYIDDVLFLYLANGITTIRGMLGDPLHLKLREQAAQNELLSPHIYTSGPGFGGNIESTEQARQRVRDQHEAGYNFLKIFPGPSLEEYNAIADEANAAGIEFSGHIPASVGLQRALEAGQTTIDHLDKYVEALVTDSSSIQEVEDPGVIYFGMHLTPYINRDRIQEVAQMTAEASTWNVPTQALSEHVLGPDSPEELSQRPEFQYMPDEMVNNWIGSKQSITGHEGFTTELAEQYLQLRRDILKTLHEADAGLLLGSDAPQIFNVPGFSVHHELRYIVEAGLTPYEAIQTGTVNPAEYLGKTQDRGTIAEGKVADMVLLEENPLDDISNSSSIAGVMYRGNWLSKEEIDKRLSEIAAKYE
ncbi:amidohydrolase family protein [Fodinibius salsisoli]|uniref:Amidohydrolase family protein n=1 Tax=Fodinibius salsisoli TaxID=2820877 RepID=A0ABT3PHP9_9BACT|nr:amidohydrolase family protein [Fodinibius salsisoli]MCW9705453.1 amidohydrolase family protein [Fodinibius salsisoli]